MTSKYVNSQKKKFREKYTTFNITGIIIDDEYRGYEYDDGGDSGISWMVDHKPCDWMGYKPSLYLCSGSLAEESHENWQASIIRMAKDIEHLFIGDPLPCYDFLRHMINLKDLIIHNAPGLESLEFIEDMTKLRSLQIVRCPQISDVAPVVRLKNRQSTKKCRSLVNLAIVDCNLENIDAFGDLTSDFDGELILSKNHIKSIEGLRHLNAYGISIAHNKVEDITPLTHPGSKVYKLNLRHNNIQNVDGIVDMMKANFLKFGRLYMRYNPISEEDYRQLAESSAYINDCARLFEVYERDSDN